jgi:RNA polymerase sigma-70 factor, ECF subfamily
MISSIENATAGDVTLLLRAWSAGDVEAVERLAPLVYAELKQIARHCMVHERKGHTLQPTALVHEAFVRLLRAQGLDLHDRAHFLALSARMMRRILISYSIARHRGKRRAVSNTIPLDDVVLGAPVDDEAILQLNEALDGLARLDARKAQIVELHFFGGLSFEETAAVLHVSERTIRRDWVFVKSWLAREMREAAGDESARLSDSEVGTGSRL